MTRGIPIHYAPLAAEINPYSQQPQMHARPETELDAYEHIGLQWNSMDNGRPAAVSSGTNDPIASKFVSHSSGQRTNTDIVIANQLRNTYKDLALSVVPAGLIDLLGYAAAGHATAIPQEDSNSALGLSHSWLSYVPASRRIDHNPGNIYQILKFGKFIYRWKPAEGRQEHEFILYIADCRDGSAAYPMITNHYILSAPGEQHLVNELLLANGQWSQELRGEIWIFDQGFWRKSAELWDSVKHASWEDVILDADMKSSIRADVEGFFSAQDTYRKLKVPWKRGIIFYGPPGNGKTISIKAMMHALYDRKPEFVPTLYVRSLKSIFGGEYSIGAIFQKARQTAPCYLVFEDLDSLVTDQLRSYFLNEVDGLRSNDGILMLGSTNHLERLDPGISKRPSRFDRKYLFPNPDTKQREAYCRFWQKKLEENKDIEFPDRLVGAIAGITKGFSFAYLQEAFVASLLAIARGEEGDKDEHDPLDKFPLWRHMKKEIQALREGLEEESKANSAKQRPVTVV